MTDTDITGVPGEASGASVPEQALSASPTDPLRVSPHSGNDPAREYVEGLERALIALRDGAEADMNRDFPEGVDGCLIDDATDALRAKHPVIWTAEQVATLDAWQECGWVHPLTCINRPHGFFDEDGDPLEDALVPTERGLFCGGCDYHQTNVPDVCFGPLPMSPAEYFAQGIEAATADATAKTGAAEGESPVPKGDAPKGPHSTPLTTEKG